MVLFGYPKCNTSRRAKKFLEEYGISYTERLIHLENPRKEELLAWQTMSGYPLKKFFNTSGQVYKSLGLKDKIPNMTQDEQLSLLAQDGMLVKRPILVGDDFVLVGFHEEEWKEKLGIAR
ncbi:MAG: arsenate reductase family protein [Lawsonibacter sp.]|jgi:arsenate reductase